MPAGDITQTDCNTSCEFRFFVEHFGSTATITKSKNNKNTEYKRIRDSTRYILDFRVITIILIINQNPIKHLRLRVL